jgi:hypothetical protein
MPGLVEWKIVAVEKVDSAASIVDCRPTADGDVNPLSLGHAALKVIAKDMLNSHIHLCVESTAPAGLVHVKRFKVTYDPYVVIV